MFLHLSLLGHLESPLCLQRRDFESCHANLGIVLRGSTARPGFIKIVVFPWKILGIVRPFFILGTGPMVVEIRGRMAEGPVEGSLHSGKGKGHGNKDNSIASPEMPEARVPGSKTALFPWPRERWSVVGSDQHAEGKGGRRLMQWGCETPWFSLSVGAVSLLSSEPISGPTALLARASHLYTQPSLRGQS